MNNYPNENHSLLVKQQTYESSYNPKLLFIIPRCEKRKDLGLKEKDALPFFGADIWNIYEMSWLDSKQKPIVATAQIIYSCSSPAVIESKSMKLYFNSFNNSVFEKIQDIENVIKEDFQKEISTDVIVKITPASIFQNETLYAGFSGECIDDLEIDCTNLLVEDLGIGTNDKLVDEVLYSNLLKSNCHVTNQPDWGSVQISYSGQQINRADLLKYIISFRNKNEFHEPCVEKIYMDIMRHCKPEKLAVYGRYTRRGGIDINAYRSSYSIDINDNQFHNLRLYRQ